MDKVSCLRTQHSDYDVSRNILSEILTQRLKKGPEFYMTNCCRAVYFGKIAQLILKNLYRRENTLSRARFCELSSDWSKTLFGSQDLVSGYKVKKNALVHDPTLCQFC